MISKYINSFKKSLKQFEDVEKKEIKITQINEFLSIIECEVKFKDSSLIIFEIIGFNGHEISKKKYKYHYQDSKNNLIFRYDNAPHHKEISTFPHHKLLPDQVIESNEPDINSMVELVNRMKI
jgi:hypothetical protein